MRRALHASRAVVGAGVSSKWNVSGLLVAVLLMAGAVYGGVQRSGFAELLGLRRVALVREEAWLLPLAINCVSLVALSPALLIGAILARAGRVRASRNVFLTLSSLAIFVLLLDLDLQRSVGRHLIEIVHIALQPHGHVAGGGIGGWVVTNLHWAALSFALSLGTTSIAQHLVAAARARLTLVLRVTLEAALWVLVAFATVAPIALENAWRNRAVLERLQGSLILDLRIGGPKLDDPTSVDPALQPLLPKLLAEYRSAFPLVTSGKPVDERPITLPARPPNVVMIVTESLRHDVFGEELMPRLTRWATGGLVSPLHDSGTNYSQSGMFALLYGRNPVVFHQTLDRQVPPQLCATLRASGYECAYFTGHPKIWQRREEYLNPQTMDHFVHDDRGTWPEWDQRALSSMLEHVSKSEKPVFAIVLLMSSHFEYQYPPRYEIDRPVADSVWRVTRVESLGPDAEVPLRNRYRNCMRFIDDLVADAIGKLDPARNLVIFTGDHGESINDDGRYTHGYSFAEIVTRTAFAMVGPGVQPQRLDHVTSHIDVLPSVLHVLSGRQQKIAYAQGIDWFAGETRDAWLEAHSPPGAYTAETQLRAAGLRLRLNLDLRAPQLTVLGFENELGQLIPTPELSGAQLAALASGFERRLEDLRR